MSDDADALVPHGLRVLFAVLRCAPWTEIKSAVAVLGFVVTGAWLMIASLKHIAIDVAALDSVLLFLTGAWGIASVAQGWKQTVAAKVASAAQTAPSPEKP